MSFYGVTDIWTYVIGAIGIILLPGPNSIFVLSVAAARGVKSGYQAAMGVFVGDTILLLLTALGAASLLRSNPELFGIVKYVGAAYLAWVGVNLIWGAIQKQRRPAGEVVVPQTISPGKLQHPFKRALVISLLNPKAILFLLSFFVQFIDPGYARPAVPFLILSAIIMALSGVYLSTLIFLGSRLAQAFRARRRLSAGLSGSVGGLFIWFGSKLATATLH